MILNKSYLRFSKSLFFKPFLKNSLISTQIIKQYQKQLQKSSSQSLHKYPVTFEEKAQLVNRPQVINHLQIVQYGVKYKKGSNWLPFILISLALSGYLFSKILPIRVNDRYFHISPETSKYISGYLFAGFNYEKPFYIYLPLMLGLYQLTRFISVKHTAVLIFANCIVGNIYGQYLVNQRVKKYEVWENERISFGEGTLLSLLYTFWSYIGFKDAFIHLKSKIFLKTLKGKGIVRRGVPFGVLCVAYGVLETFFFQRGAKNSQIICSQVALGIMMGLILRRVKPLIK